MPYFDAQTPVDKPTKIIAMNRLHDGTLLILTETENGHQVLNLEQMLVAAEDLLFQYFEERLLAALPTTGSGGTEESQTNQ
jgi:hypothetical protein